MSRRDPMLGKTILDKRTGVMWTVVRTDITTLFCTSGNDHRTVSRRAFDRWFSLVKEGGEEEQEPVVVLHGDVYRSIPTGIAGIGPLLRDDFIAMLEENNLEGLHVVQIPSKPTYYSVKYNHKNVFEMRVSSKRFHVFCHPKSLAPHNRPHVYRIVPDSWGWNLAAQFVFTTGEERPLMRAIITDGLYYREEKEV